MNNPNSHSVAAWTDEELVKELRAGTPCGGDPCKFMEPDSCMCAAAAASIAAKQSGPDGSEAKDAARYRWLNRKDNFIIQVQYADKRSDYRLKCGEVLDRWIDMRLAEERSATPDGQG